MKTEPTSLLRHSAILAAATTIALATSAHAADFTWDGGTGNWTDTNWNSASSSGPTTAGNTATINSGTVTANVGGPGALDSITIGSGAQLNFYNGDGGIYAYQGVSNLILQGGTVNGGSGTYNAYGASIIGNLSVSGSAASTITGSSWFNINPSTTFTVADVTGDTGTDLLVSTSLRGPAGSPDYTYAAALIIKEGAGTMEVTQHSYFRGGLDLNGGTLKVSGGNGGYGFFDGAVTVNSGTTLTIDSDGTGFGYQNGWKPTSVNINGGTVNGGGNHIWGISGGVNMTGGTLQSGGFQWNHTDLTTNASADTATIDGALNLRGDGGYTTMAVAVADGAAATDLLISGNITEGNGSVGISKSGAGTMVLSGSNSYTGATTVSEGTLVLSGASISTSATTVQSGATLGGAGTVGAVTVESGGFLSPGSSPGILTVDGDYSQAGTLTIEINGVTPGSLHDQVNVDRASGDGLVSLSGSLDVLFGGGYVPANSDLIFILLNDASDPVSGSFNGLAQDDIVTSYGGYDWRISYTADSAGATITGGNDIALLAVPEHGATLLGALGLVVLLRRRRAR